MDDDAHQGTHNVGQQEAQLPQRNSASAAHLYLSWLIDRALHYIRMHLIFPKTRVIGLHFCR